MTKKIHSDARPLKDRLETPTESEVLRETALGLAFAARAKAAAALLIADGADNVCLSLSEEIVDVDTAFAQLANLAWMYELTSLEGGDA